MYRILKMFSIGKCFVSLRIFFRIILNFEIKTVSPQGYLKLGNPAFRVPKVLHAGNTIK